MIKAIPSETTLAALDYSSFIIGFRGKYIQTLYFGTLIKSKKTGENTGLSSLIIQLTSSSGD
jgi:hypothetical protein